MNLLIITDNSDVLVERFQEHVDTVDTVSPLDLRVDTGTDQEVRVQGQPLQGYDALYLDPNPRTAIFSRVLLDVLLNRDIALNIDPETFYILAKKHYLYQVLAEKGVTLPATAAISTDKGVGGVTADLDFPMIGKKYERFTRRDMNLLANAEELESFAEHMGHGSHVLVLQEQISGDVYDCLYIDGDIVSLKLVAEGWRKRRGDAKQSYHSISSDLEQVVAETAAAIGADLFRVRLVNGKVVDAYLDPDLERFKKVSGKNVYGTVVDYLAGET